VATLRALLAPTGWLDRTRAFARGLRKATRTPGGLLLVGTPAEEPWHLTAHMDEESRLSGIPELMPTLVRWEVPAGAPPHLRVGLERLEAARRGETFQETIVREVREETGLTVRVGPLVELRSGFRYRVEAYYEAALVGGVDGLVLDRREVLEARLFAPGELPAGMPPLHRQLARSQGG